MRRVPIYSKEIDDGIANAVASTISVAYNVQVDLINPTKEQKEKGVLLSNNHRMLFAEAHITDVDLYFTKSILVSTNKNNNEDVFLPKEVWLARHTPSHKPDNLNHDQKLIVGHTIDVWPITSDGSIIPDDIPADQLPELFHLLNSAVIYKRWKDENMAMAVADLIEKIKSGVGKVSMECLFSDFDYAIITENGDKKIITRNAETAFLTKYLRAYGGKGEYGSYRVWRVFRNIVFAGKGYVTNGKPANSLSIVFSEENAPSFAYAKQINTFSEDNGVLIDCKDSVQNKQEIITMPDNDAKVLESQIAELKSENQKLQAKHEILMKEAAQATQDAFDKKLASLSQELELSKKSLVEANSALAESKDVNTKLTQKIEDLNAAKAETDKKFDELKAASTKTSRLAMLVSAGIPSDAAANTVDKFIKLGDEQFKEIVDMAVAAYKKDNKPIGVNLNNAEPNKDLALATVPNEENTQILRKSIVDWYKNTHSKDE